MKQSVDTIHILGNGPSISMFNPNDWERDHQEFIGCNFSDPELKPDYTVIMDAKPMMKLLGGHKLSIPAVISDRCTKYLDGQEGWRKIPDDSLKVIDTIGVIHEKGKKFPMSSGHHATLYGINKHKETLKTIHLWGMDSIWADDISSSSDKHFRKGIAPKGKLPVVSVWRTYWNEIFDKHQDINFIIQGKNENIS